MGKRMQTFYRDVSIDPASIDTENRIVAVSFSSDQPLARYDWDGPYNEILGHAKDNVDLTRLSEIGVCLFNHDPDQPIGKVLSPAIDAKALKGTAKIQFDSDDASDVIYQKVLSGTLKGVSVGYRVSAWESVADGDTSADGQYKGPCEIASMWEPFEISIVSVPADATVGVGRSMDDIQKVIQKAVTAEFKKLQSGAMLRGVVPANISTETAHGNVAWKEPVLKDFTDKKWADLTDEEKQDVAGHFAWAAQLPPDTFDDLKLPHHEPKDGKVVWRAVAHCAGRLDQSDIPSADEDKVKAHLALHYAAFGKKAPWEDEGTKSDNEDSDDMDDAQDDEDLGGDETDDTEDDDDEEADKPKRKKKKLGGEKAMELKVVRAEAARAERARVTELRAMFRAFGDQTSLVEDDFIEAGTTAQEARRAIMEDITKNKAKAVPQTPEIQFIADEEDKFRAAAVDGLAWRSGLKLTKPAPGFEALRSVNMVDLGRIVYERTTGKRFESFDRDLLVREMIQSSVFSYILQNVADKAMQNAYQFAPVTYPLWTKHGVLNDYKPALRAQLSEVPLLENVGKGAEYKLITMTDAGEFIQLSKRGNLFSVTREDILNDDMHALVDFPARWAAAARMTINQDVYSALTGNPVMGYDGNPIFCAQHNNIATANKTAPSKVSLQAAIQAMMLQTGLQTPTPLNIRPKFLLSPVALMFNAKQLLQSAADNSQANPAVINTLQDVVTLITDPLLDAANSSAWYLTADPSVTDTIEVAFMSGQDTPYIEQQSAFRVDGFTYKIRIEYGVKALDWRGLYLNPGK